jgi:hypothetical protein
MYNLLAWTLTVPLMQHFASILKKTTAVTQYKRQSKRSPGGKPLRIFRGATENTAVVQALIDNLIERGLDPKVPPVHSRRRQGAEQSDPPHLRRPYADPAVPNQ